MTAALQAAGYVVEGVDISRPVPASPGFSRCQDARDFFWHATGYYDVVVHAAAVVGGRAAIDGTPLALAVNLELDAALFQWAVRTRPGRIVYLSSSAAYPVELQQPGSDRRLREHDIMPSYPMEPDALYGWIKLTGEHLADLARAEGLRVSVVRPFSGYGEDQGGDYPFPSLFARACAREDPFEIWGSGEQVRDFIHADDICGAILAMVREGIDGPVNLGTGRAMSMRQLAEMMCTAAGYGPEFKALPEKPAGVAYRVADVTRMREFYKPKVALEEGVTRITERNH
jgi:nucleoside-diphosphate-sugar epimerase